MSNTTNTLLIAAGTDDNLTLSPEHFGSARFFQIFSIDLQTKKMQMIETRENVTPDENHHGDPKKARSVSELLSDMQIFLCKLMGKNIVRIRNKFIPILSKELKIELALKALVEILPELKIEANKPKGTARKVFKIH